MKIKIVMGGEEIREKKERDDEKRMKIVIKKSGLRMVSSSFYIPKGHKLKPLGEDSHFVSADHQTLGVADGVGGWEKLGIDSGEFARALMLNSAAAVRSALKADPTAEVDPKKILEEAFSGTAGIKGASTACVVAHSNGTLRSANVGDSGFMVLRNGKVAFRSRPQQRRFNCPFQLGNSSDRPDAAEVVQLAVGPGDIVVAGTDGLLDNMFDSDIEAIVAATGQNEAKPEELAWKIAEEAYYKSLDKYFVSPFARESRINGKTHRGGKMDDITVVVAKIVPHYDLQLCAN